MSSARDMMKSIIEGSEVLPDIDKQIEFIQHFRKDVIPIVTHFETGLEMISAIEQSLIAAKVFFRNSNTKAISTIQNVVTTESCNRILNSFKVKATLVRVEVLKQILSSDINDFTVSAIHKALSRNKTISKSAVIATIILFKKKNLVHENKNPVTLSRRLIGRPEVQLHASAVLKTTLKNYKLL